MFQILEIIFFVKSWSVDIDMIMRQRFGDSRTKQSSELPMPISVNFICLVSLSWFIYGL